jgi:DNA replication protein DnaC
MSDHIARWNRCLQLIKEYLPKDVKLIPADDVEWVYNTWFAPVTCESFDPDTGALVLCVPDRHVCEYIEHYRLPLWSWAIQAAFGRNARLSYRIARPVASVGFSHGVLNSALPHTRLQFSVPNARERLEQELQRAVGPGYQWLRYQGQNGKDICYDKIADWLSDNKGKGLLFVGTTGVGKSVMCRDILPAIIGGNDKDKIPVVTAEQMLTRADELKRASVVVIDGLGHEERMNYGKTNNTFLDLCEASVQGGPLLIINTQLSTTPVHTKDFPLSIEERYGREVLDRLAAVTTMALYSGKSLW